jgi:hypothetical protein
VSTHRHRLGLATSTPDVPAPRQLPRPRTPQTPVHTFSPAGTGRRPARARPPTPAFTNMSPNTDANRPSGSVTVTRRGSVPAGQPGQHDRVLGSSESLMEGHWLCLGDPRVDQRWGAGDAVVRSVSSVARRSSHRATSTSLPPHPRTYSSTTSAVGIRGRYAGFRDHRPINSPICSCWVLDTRTAS